MEGIADDLGGFVLEKEQPLQKEVAALGEGAGLVVGSPRDTGAVVEAMTRLTDGASSTAKVPTPAKTSTTVSDPISRRLS